jgi:hypothetical protein
MKEVGEKTEIAQQMKQKTMRYITDSMSFTCNEYQVKEYEKAYK